ncbi:Stretchin-Mlck, isoform A, partial [Operophtera brumata]
YVHIHTFSALVTLLNYVEITKNTDHSSTTKQTYSVYITFNVTQYPFTLKYLYFVEQRNDLLEQIKQELLKILKFPGAVCTKGMCTDMCTKGMCTDMCTKGMCTDMFTKGMCTDIRISRRLHSQAAQQQLHKIPTTIDVEVVYTDERPRQSSELLQPEISRQIGKIRLEVAAEEAPTGEDPPSFLRRLQDLTVKVGSRTRFLVEIISSTECKVSRTNNTVKVTWYRNERRLLEAERVALARDGNFWCADVAAVSVDDAGRWTCTAENAGGRASCSAHLNVLANAEDPTSLGTYTCEAVNCMGRAYSSSKVHVVGRASREGSARPSSRASLLLLQGPRCRPRQQGRLCPAQLQGEPTPPPRSTLSAAPAGKALLGPVPVPKNYRKPRFMENLQAVLTEEGLVSFECKVVGFPTPVLSWFKDGQELKPGDVYQLTGTNSLGSYCCIARNCMGQASSSAELTVEDIQNQLNEEEKLQLFSKNQAPKFIQGLKSVEAKIDEPFRFTIKVAIPPEPSVLWYRDDQPVDESTRCRLDKEDKGLFNLDIQNLEFLDQAEWKCVAMNDFGHSVTSCFLKLIIPRHYKKPRFLENLQAILSDEGAVNLECKVIGVPQPVLKWYKDGEELKPGDIHRIISGQDGTCCLGTYTCEAQNCMGIAASSASLLGFDDSMKTKTKKTEEQPLQRNLSLSTIHEERTSQMYDTPVGDITLDDKGEISFSFDGKEVSVSLYETPDLTEEEALQIVEMYADQLSENVTEQNVVELPPLRFVKETSTSGNLLMEAIIIDVSPDYFAAPEEDLRTEADVEDLSIADENGPPQLSLDQDIEIGGEDYLEKTMALLSEERSDYAVKSSRKKSDSQRSADDYFSLSRDQSLSEEKRDDDTHVSESELQSFASARSSTKVKSKSSKPSGEEGQESSEPTKTILLKEEIVAMPSKKEDSKLSDEELPVIKPKRERRHSRGSRRSSTSSEKSISKSREELLRLMTDIEQPPKKPIIEDKEFKKIMSNISSSLTKVINDVQLIERDIILKSELMSSAATASRSLEIISSLITPLSEIHSIADAAKESVSESREVTSTIFNSIPQPLNALKQSLTIIEKCIDMESDNKTLVKKTCVAFIETCGIEVQKVISDITSVTTKDYILTEDNVINEIDSVASEITTVINFSNETIKARNLLTEASEIKSEELTLETKHMRDTQKAVFELKSPLNSLLWIVESAESGKMTDLAKIKNSEFIMNGMSAFIQDLQTALEQIESLSMKESSSTLQKYNTEIIETVMDSVLKLRGLFELLSIEPNTEEDKTMLKHTLSSLKENLTEISHKIDVIDNIVGQFDVLQSENKLDILQKMAQILIALENNLPRLEAMPEVKSHMDTFHKHLTKVLEKVIESNDAQKYVTMMGICDTVNIINSTIKNLDSENVLPLASLSNTMTIIQNQFAKIVFESELNCSITNNISAVLVGIQEAINTAEEISLQIDSEYIKDFSTQVIDEEKVNIILEHIDRTIAAVNTIKTIEITQELKLALTPAFENICPTLEELRRSVASIRSSEVEQGEQVFEISEASFGQTIATPLCELNQNIIVLNQLIVENIEYIKENTEVITAIAEPLHELHITLEILQQDIISQYGDDLTPYEVSVNMASVVQSLQSCIVIIHEQAGMEGADEMSTLEDISGIKTSADTLPSDHLVLPTAEVTAIEQSLPPYTQKITTMATAQTLQTLNEHVTVLQTPEVIEALDILSEISDYSGLKSVVVSLGDLHTGLEGILHPVPIEGSIDLEDLVNISKLAAIAEPMQEIQQSLSVLDTSNIPIYENILDLPAEKIHSVFQSISEFKISLEQCMYAVLPAMEIANNTIEISNKVSTLREVCELLKEIFETSKDLPCDIALRPGVQNLEIVVDSLIDATDVSKDIKIDQVKSITEELYLKIMEVQEEIINFTTQSPELISQEAKLIQLVSDVEMNIAVLEQYDFVDLSRVSNITACNSPQLAIEIDSESLAQIHDIAENAVNVLQDSYQETPVADLLIVEQFYKTCKNEFTILRCLISKATSHKKIIRLLQEFSSLQTMINNFTTKRLELRLSVDVNECLTNFLIHANECLKKARTSLVKVIDTQSDMLIKTPVAQLESIHELAYVVESKANTTIANVIRTLVDVAETSKLVANNLHCAIIQELSQPNLIPTPTQEEIDLTIKMEELAMIVDAQSEPNDLDESTEKVLEKLTTCFKKHHDYKDALGTGKTLIILKCLAECAAIVQEKVTRKQMSMHEATETKENENSLKKVLAEMLQPLQALQTELINVREQVLSGTEEDSISIEISTTESIMQTMAELHKDIVQQIESDKSTVDNEDISLIMEVDKEIHSIQDSIKSMDNVQVAQAVKEITKPMEDIEKTLLSVLSADKDTLKEILPKETTVQLSHHIDQYIELTEIVEEISAIINIEEVKETFDIARELRENIAASESISTNEHSKELLNDLLAVQTRLAQKLQMGLYSLQVQVLDSAQELAPALRSEALQRISQVTAQLHANLVAVTGVQNAVHSPALLSETTEFVEAVPDNSASTTPLETIVAITQETMVLEQHLHSVDIDTCKEQNKVTSELLEKMAVVSQEPMVVELDKLQQKNSDNVPINTLPLVGTETNEIFNDQKAQKTESRVLVNESTSVKIDSLEITTATEATTEISAVEPIQQEVAKEVYSHNIKTSQQSIKKIDEAFTTAQENLLQHIDEYVSEDIIKAVTELSSLMNAEDLKESINIAKELRESIAAIEIGITEEIFDEMSYMQERQKVLIQGLQTALSVFNEQTLEHLHEIFPLVNKTTIEKVVIVTENLKTDLVRISQQEVIQSAKQDQQEFKTGLVSVQLLKEDETLEQAKFLTEVKENSAAEITQSTVTNSTKLITVEPTSESAGAADTLSTEGFKSSEVLTESNAVVEEIVVKQDAHDIEEKSLAAETKQKIAAEHTATFIREEIKDSLQSASQEIDCDILTQASVTEPVEINQQVTSVEEISKDAISAQKVDSIQIAAIVADATEVKDEVKVFVISEQLLTPKVRLDSSAITEEKVDLVAVTSDITTVGELLEDSLEAVVSDENASVATETATVSQLIEPVVEYDEVMTHIDVQTIEKSNEVIAKAKVSLSYEEQGVANFISQLSDNLMVFLSTVTLLQNVKLDSKEELKETVVIENFSNDQIFNNLEKEHVSSNQDGQLIEIYNDQKLLEATDFVDSSLKHSNIYKEEEKAELSSQKEYPLSETPETALTETTQPFEEFFDSPTSADTLASAELIANETGEMTILEQTQNLQKEDEDTESAIFCVSVNLAAVTDVVNVIETTELSKSLCYTAEAIADIDEFEKSSLEDATGNKVKIEETTILQENAVHEATNSCKNESLQNISNETTKPLETFFDPPKLVDELPTAELIGETEQITILEHTNCFEKHDEATRSATLGMSDTTAVTIEVNNMDTTEISIDEGSTIELVAFSPEVELDLFDFAVRSKLNIEDTTDEPRSTTFKGFLASPAFAEEFPSTELNVIEIEEISVLEGNKNFNKEGKSAESATLSVSDNLVTAFSDEVKVTEATRVAKTLCSDSEVVTLSPEGEKSLLEVTTDSEINVEETTVQRDNTTQSIAILCDDIVPVFVQDTIIFDSDTSQQDSLALETLENYETETNKPFEEYLNLPILTESIPTVELSATEIAEITMFENTENFEKEWIDSKSSIVDICDGLASVTVNVAKGIEIKKDNSSTAEVNAEKITTLQENVTLEIGAICDGAKTVLEQDNVIVDNELAMSILQSNKELLLPVKIGNEMFF